MKTIASTAAAGREAARQRRRNGSRAKRIVSIFIRGFATIKAVTTAPKKARNISKGVTVSIPAKNTAKLVLSKELKERMNLKE